MAEKRAYRRPSDRTATGQRRAAFTAAQATLLIVSIASTVLSFSQFGFSWTFILIAVLVVALTISLSANIASVLDRRRERRSAKHIAFLTPSGADEPFYTALLTALVRATALVHGERYVIVPALPAESFDDISIWTLFESLEARQVDIDGIIFVPNDPDNHFDELVGFHETRGDIPLVLADVYFDLDNCDERTKGRLPSFVGGDERLGGRLAAEIINRSLHNERPTNPRVLIVNGANSPWERLRASSMRARLEELWGPIEFSETGPINYSRALAFETCERLFRALANTEREVHLDAIFACNDDMAIGARSAIARLGSAGYVFEPRPQIVGYDGIPEMRQYIESGDEYIAGTVDVRISEQAKAALRIMHLLIRKGERRGQVELVPPGTIVRRGI